MTLLEGRKWKTSIYFPGDVAPPVDKTVVYSVQMDASMGPCWGGSTLVAYCENPLIRATGLYLSPGEIATIQVPASMVGKGFRIQVGASNANNINKNTHKRMDRVTTTFDINDVITYVGNPLGGGIYIRVPYLATEGVVTVSISGGVVQAPIFEKTSVKTTTATEWNTLRTAPGAWADFVTDKFLLQVPRVWMYDYTYAEMDALLTNYDLSMDGVSELCGYTPQERNNYVVYVAPDLHIRHGSFGIGYPQVNNVVFANSNGIQPLGPAGRTSHWFLTDPYGDDTFYHELGHMQQQTRYRGETEAQVNLLITYVQNVKFGIPLDTAFIASFPRTGIHTVDAAAISWMVKENYRAGNEMDYSNTINDEFRYQHRGYAKYADIARLFGWPVVTNMYRQEHLDHIQGNAHYCPGLANSDYRTLKLSLQAGVDLTPLIHFWGIHPVDSQLLQQCMDNYSLPSSDAIKQQLIRYAGLVPVTQQDFIDHFEEVWPGKKDCNCCPSTIYGCGWYNFWYPSWDGSVSTVAITATLDIVDLYFPDEPSDPPSAAPTESSDSPSSAPSESSDAPSAAPVPAPSDSPSTAPVPEPSETPSVAPVPVPCVNTKPTGWCGRRLNNCPNLSQCALACGTCNTTPDTPAPVVPTIPQTPAPVVPTIPQTPAPVVPTNPQTPAPVTPPQCVGHGSRCDIDTDCCSGNCKNNGKCQGNRLLRRHLQGQGKGPAGVGPPGLDRADVQGKLDTARGKWKSKDIRNYDLELWRDFFGKEELMGPFIIKIRNNKLISAKYKFTGNIVEEEVLREIPNTMDEVYDLIHFESNQNIDNMDVIYSDGDGHPMQVFFARAEGDDEEGAQVYFLRNFEKQ